MHYARRRTRRTADRTYQQQATWRRRSRPGRRSRPARACRAPPAPLPLEPASLPLRPAQPPQQRPSRRRGRLHHTDREARPSGPSRLACAWHARPAPLPLEPASAPSLSEPARHPEQRRSRRSGRLHPTDREARPLGPLARLARAWRAWQAPAVPPAVPLRPAHAPERRRPRRSGRPDPAGRHERPPEAQKRDFRLLRCQIPEYRPVSKERGQEGPTQNRPIATCAVRLDRAGLSPVAKVAVCIRRFGWALSGSSVVWT